MNEPVPSLSPAGAAALRPGLGAIFLVAKVFAPRAAPNKIAAFIIAVSIAFIMSAAIAFIGGRYSPRAPSTLSFVATWLGCSLLISFVTVRYILGSAQLDRSPSFAPQSWALFSGARFPNFHSTCLSGRPRNA